MKEYLGVVPPNDALGVLQDIHWSFGGLGYFSTYALGNLISAQLWEKINSEITDLSTQIRAGKFDALLGWLRANIHVHGRKYEPQELVQKVTGSRITPAPYLRYLETKFKRRVRAVAMTENPFSSRKRVPLLADMKTTRLLLLLASFWTLSGCGPSGPYPTPIPPEILPTAIVQTAEALNATAFALTPSPTVTSTPTITPTPNLHVYAHAHPARAACRACTSKRPGRCPCWLRRFKCACIVVPGETNLVQVALFGEDGRLLWRDLFIVQDVPPPGLELFLETPFEIRVAELARLEVSTDR